MMKSVSIVLVCLLQCVFCVAQPAGPNKAAVAANKMGTQSPSLKIEDKNMASANQSSTGRMLNVLFATNDDCRLYIDGETKGLIGKNRFLYLKLPAGTYSYTAKSLTSGDEWRDTLSVAEEKTNEVFVDMLYAIDKGKELWASIQSKTPPGTAANKPQTAGGDQQSTNKEREQDAIKSIVANMVLIKGGVFVMGNNKSPSADEVEHPVMLKDFFMSKYEVTQQQWEYVMGYNPSVHAGCAACPVENITWEEAMVFVRKINGTNGKRFRLPTEAEWEYVARMGGKAEIEKAGSTEAYIKNTAWAFTNANNKTHPVGTKQPNVSGVYDLIGNVSEWCMDWYGAFFFREDFTEKDPEGPPLGKEKVVRGGNYKDYLGDRFRPSFRNKINPKSKGSEIGFRLVMEVPE